MKNFAILAMLITGLMFSSCEKENKVAEEMPSIQNFEEFKAWAGDRLVYSEEHSDDDFDCYLYYAEGTTEPAIIAQPKESFDKKPPLEIECRHFLSRIENVLVCSVHSGNSCEPLPSGNAMFICDWTVLAGENR